MRDDVLILEVLAKCDFLKQAGFWPNEAKIRPRAWLNNFDEIDKGMAAYLLDKFTYYNDNLTNALLIAAYHSIGDGLEKGPEAPRSRELVESLSAAVFTPVTGEEPNPTDSGNLFCRKARQVLEIPEERVVEPSVAVKHAENGNTVVFLDDFVGSGDQFITSWNRSYSRSRQSSFAEAFITTGFTSIYIPLVTTDFGLERIHNEVPTVAVCATHILDSKSTIQGMKMTEATRLGIYELLEKYSERLCPKDHYIANTPTYKKFGFRERGLLFGFEHSIPDAALPIFWAPGTDNWEPLIERV